MTPKTTPLEAPPTRQRANPICKCGRIKTVYNRRRGIERVCNPCRRERQKAICVAAVTAMAPPTCEKCGKPKTKAHSGYARTGHRWICRPCFSETCRATHRAAKEPSEPKTPVVIPELPERVAASPKKSRRQSKEERPLTFTEALWREHMARECRWRKPVANPSRAVRHACYPNNPKMEITI